ncbi:MAG TPA: hypothetical protein VIX13_05220 [Candidatus Eisenbacteria bacterium]
MSSALASDTLGAGREATAARKGPRRAIVLALLGAAGLALYLWPALAAPVVRWSDSEADMAWAKARLGITRPVPAPEPGGALGHQPKPAYLLFLRGAMRVFPFLGEARSIVLIQSLLLWASILGTAGWVARQTGTTAGVLFGVACLALLRLRDASSAVMPEAVSTALLLPLVAALLYRPRSAKACALLGIAGGVLYFVRPNSGGAAFLMGIVAFAVPRELRRLLVFVTGFAVTGGLGLTLLHPTPPGDPLHGLGYQILEASADYYWTPSIGQWPVEYTPGDMARAEVRRAAANWAKMLRSNPSDVRRELVWRAFHGLFGVEYYDANWCETYRRLSIAGRVISPFLLIISLAVLAAAPWRAEMNVAKGMAIALLAIVVGQDLVLGSNPRYVLPFLPLLFVLASSATNKILPLSLRRVGLLCLSGSALLLLLVLHRYVLDWQWGQVERAGVSLVQRIPRAALPSQGPATLHIRIAAPLLPTGARLRVRGPGEQILYTGLEEPHPALPYLTILLPESIIRGNRQRPIELRLESFGRYDPSHYLLFPVIPAPWAGSSRREGEIALSPRTGIRTGALDWWAHGGMD